MMETVHSCCHPSSTSPIWEGSPTGEIIDIDGIEVYISQPGASRTSAISARSTADFEEADRKPLTRVILFLTEAHGIYLPNAQLLADSFASQLGCDVIMPDQFAGQPRLLKDSSSLLTERNRELQIVPWTEDKNDQNYENRGLRIPLKDSTENSDAYPFMVPAWGKEQEPDEFEQWKKRHEPPITDPILGRVVEYIHGTYGNDASIGGVGYCFGGRYVIRLMVSGTIDVGVVNHPSFFTMEEVQKLSAGKRLAIYAAEKDDVLPPEKRRQTEDLLTTGGVSWMSTVFGGTEHGFSVRGDLTVKEVQFAKEQAFRGAVSWFDEWL